MKHLTFFFCLLLSFAVHAQPIPEGVYMFNRVEHRVLNETTRKFKLLETKTSQNVRVTLTKKGITITDGTPVLYKIIHHEILPDPDPVNDYAAVHHAFKVIGPDERVYLASLSLSKLHGKLFAQLSLYTARLNPGEYDSEVNYLNFRIKDTE